MNKPFAKHAQNADVSDDRSLDIIGHWNAKRSSVPYLVYWALDVVCLRWLSCILIGGHGWSQWEGENW
ncbi:hypothetical protein TNCV_4450631 [Trichonephila clavipes]|nr:hypothetical protein TNCV_4450631 [Trichonephila clavipes]